MKPVVIYSSKSGNTEKVAGEIASELNCPCTRITKDFDSSTINLNEFDVVFVGTGNYGGKPSVDMLNFLQGIDLESTKQFALFITWFGRKSSYEDVFDMVRATVEGKGQKIMENCYKCLGDPHSRLYSTLSRTARNAQGHPNAEDLNAAKEWAREITGKV